MEKCIPCITNQKKAGIVVLLVDFRTKNIPSDKKMSLHNGEGFS